MITSNSTRLTSKDLLPHGPVGIGGWLILPLIGLITSPFVIIAYLMIDVFPFLTAEGWESIASKSGEYYHPLFGPFVITDLIICIAQISTVIVLLILFFKKKTFFPKVMITCLTIMLIIDILIGYINLQIIENVFGSDPLTSQYYMFNVIRAMISTSIWITYFSKSKRVKNTFVK
ncbi:MULTISPECIES: DUF2569 family protein [unclassified Psychrobacillus]|uniref:DUF2569 family protein n=1 Tax=unclassified Psychrobacillus TaxID=2636677 RepID=UPI001469D471|nr:MULTISPECIES: DUF2569 family protein [unclassified Psychrobacillus]MCM3358207.1 DUF2569 domain-containing protein [Psychrobacillus sp. MER TA 171]NME07184.1 DUF2569 domain-containing protein [Psychrobacillus sp. BL-248-WT-3]